MNHARVSATRKYTRRASHTNVISLKSACVVIKKPQQKTNSIASLFAVTALVFSILLSAFTLIYTKDLNRRLFIQYHNAQQQQQQYQIEWGKLLLEQSAWSTQARIQRIAQQHLSMMAPAAKDVVMVEE